MFAIILGYLRADYLKDLTGGSLKELEVEAEYFMLSSLQKIINQRKDVNVIVEGHTFKCKPHALQYCDKNLIDQNGDFNASKTPRNICQRCHKIKKINVSRDCCSSHETTLEDVVRRVLRRLEDNRVGNVKPPMRTELREDSWAALWMGLLPDYPNPKWFY